jgi:hypothetical protein
LSKEEEGKLLSLSADQKKIVMDNDKKAKNEYLGTIPNVNNPGIKSHEKFKNFVDVIGTLTKGR